MKFFLLLSSFLLISTACSDSIHRETPITKTRGPAPELSYPRPPLSLDETELVREAASFDDLFELEKVVKLEATDASTIGYMRQLRFVGDRLVVLDDIQMAVFMFDDQGNFLHRIGRQGKGPGEYTEPVNVYINESEILVIDTNENQILFYNFDGTHNRTIRPDNSKFNVFLYGNIIVKDNLLYVCDFHSLNKNMPKHVVLDASKNPAEPVFGFGDRLPFYTTRIGQKTTLLPTNIFEEVNGTIWTIPGYQTAIDVFDFNGHKLGSIPSGVDGISPDIVSNIKKAQDFNDAISMIRAAFMFHHSQLVFVYFMSPLFVNAYDYNGNLIRKMPVMQGAVKNARFMENGYLVGVMNTTSTAPDHLKRSLGDILYSAFLDAGYNPEDYENDNDYLILFEPKW